MQDGQPAEATHRSERVYKGLALTQYSQYYHVNAWSNKVF